MSIVLTSAEQFFLYFENSIVYFPKSAVQNPGILFGKPFIIHCKIYTVYIFDRSGFFGSELPHFPTDITVHGAIGKDLGVKLFLPKFEGRKADRLYVLLQYKKYIIIKVVFNRP